jgi:hypothetical protein
MRRGGPLLGGAPQSQQTFIHDRADEFLGGIDISDGRVIVLDSQMRGCFRLG